ncbi:MAG: hypothetical protein AB1492_02310 [Bacillota bacterium]
MRKDKAVVLKLGGPFAIVLTDGGAFRRILRKPGMVEGGICHLTPDWTRRAAAVAAAASLLLAVGGASAAQVMLNPTVATLSIDINPSFELGLNLRAQVTFTRARNDDAAAVLEGAHLRNLNVYEAVTALVERSAALGYIASTAENAVLATVTPLRAETPPVVNTTKLEAAVVKGLGPAIREAVVNVRTGTQEELKESRKEGVSPNLLDLVKEAQNRGVEVKVKEILERGVGPVLANKGLQVRDLVGKGQDEDDPDEADSDEEDAPDTEDDEDDDSPPAGRSRVVPPVGPKGPGSEAPVTPPGASPPAFASDPRLLPGLVKPKEDRGLAAVIAAALDSRAGDTHGHPPKAEPAGQRRPTEAQSGGDNDDEDPKSRVAARLAAIWERLTGNGKGRGRGND